jgi:hypothetical protein
MGVIRVPHNDNFTMMANYHLKDRRLSLRAVGLMSKMLSLPDDWDYTVTGLAAICKEGREAVRKVLQELEEAGYLERDQSREGGRFSGYDYNLYEQPRGGVPASAGETPSPGFLGNGEPPSPRIPVPGFPVPENPPQSSTKESSTKNNPPKPPRGRREKKEKASCDWMPEMFERFWKLYPRGEDKAAARYEWDLLRPDPTLMQTMSAALKRQMMTDEWQRGVGIPYACRWLSKRRWEAAEKLPGLSAVPDQSPSEEAIEWEN